MAAEGNGDAPDPLKVYEDKLEDIERVIAEAEKKEEERAKEMEAEIKKQMEERLRGMEEQMNKAFENRMRDIEHRYQSHAREKQASVATRQTDVLRINKMLRDVSRSLTPGEWEPVFLILMDSFPRDVVDAEVDKIQQEKPFIQAFKALTKWKEMKGQDFRAYELSEALRQNNRYDLAEMVLDILDTEGDALISLNNFGKTNRPPSGGASGIGGATGVNGVGDQPRPSSIGSDDEAKPSLKRLDSSTEDYQGPLGDTKLLQLSRKLGDKWYDLGSVLGVCEEDLNEIRDNETGHLAAFKMLWGWRDNLRTLGSEAAGVDTLISGLEGVGKSELASIIQANLAASNA